VRPVHFNHPDATEILNKTKAQDGFPDQEWWLRLGAALPGGNPKLP